MKSAINTTNRHNSGTVSSTRSKMRQMTNREAPSQTGTPGRGGNMPDMTNGDVKAPRTRAIKDHNTISLMGGMFKPRNGSMERSLSMGRKK